MKRWIHAVTAVNNEIQDIVDKIATKYEMKFFVPKEEYVLKGDSVTFKVNNHNVYRVVFVPEGQDAVYIIFQCVRFAFQVNGHEHYDDAVDYKDEVVDYTDAFDTVVRWVNECEADDPTFTIYED